MSKCKGGYTTDLEACAYIDGRQDEEKYQKKRIMTELDNMNKENLKDKEPLLIKGATQIAIREIKKRLLEKNDNIIIKIKGKTKTGMSQTAISIGRRVK